MTCQNPLPFGGHSILSMYNWDLLCGVPEVIRNETLLGPYLIITWIKESEESEQVGFGERWLEYFQRNKHSFSLQCLIIIWSED